MTTTMKLAAGAVALLACSTSAGAQGHRTPEASAADGGSAPALFEVAGSCMACHNGLTGPGGLDIGFGTDWRASMMANSARDPYWQAAVRRETLEHPSVAGAIQDECSKCHMPAARFEAHVAGRAYEAFGRLPWQGRDTRTAALAADGVTCTVCHQIRPEGLGHEETFTGGFHIDSDRPMGSRVVFGPYDLPPGATKAMLSSGLFEPTRGEHIQESSFCASCHTLYTHARGPEGEVIGELPEQVPFLEWLHSDYPGERSCQSCHMPEVGEPTAISSVLATERENVSRHVFRGGNFFMPRVFSAFRDELAVEALPSELELLSLRTRANLRERTARLSLSEPRIEGDRLAFTVEVRNLAGHKLPTAYPSRRVWLHVSVADTAGRTLFESGALRPDGSIAGNDNDADAGRFEPHHTVIREPGQVQVYEAIMTDRDGRVTTGLIHGVTFVKDNRILPAGFVKGDAGSDIAVRGAAAGDDDFAGGTDAVRFDLPVAERTGPVRVTAELWYQPIAFRWARNLEPFESVETDRFVRFYDALAGESAALLDRAESTSEPVRMEVDGSARGARAEAAGSRR